MEEQLHAAEAGKGQAEGALEEGVTRIKDLETQLETLGRQAGDAETGRGWLESALEAEKAQAQELGGRLSETEAARSWLATALEAAQVRIILDLWVCECCFHVSLQRGLRVCHGLVIVTVLQVLLRCIQAVLGFSRVVS